MSPRPERLSEAVTLYEGDCLDVLPTLVGVDAVVTDPPYGVSFAAQPTKWQMLAGHKPESWDNSAPDIGKIIEIADEIIIWGGNYFSLPPSRGWLSWYKPDAPPSMASFEMAWTNIDMNARQYSCSISSTNPERVGHPTQKPLRLMRWCIQKLKGQTILDPFAGSGTTGVAAILEGRRAILIEKDPRYCEIIRRRIAEAESTGPQSLFREAKHPELFAECVV